jgi:hypothetical protein
MSRALLATLTVLMLILPSPASAAGGEGLPGTALTRSPLAGHTDTAAANTSTAANPEAPIPVARSNIPPAGRKLSANEVIAIAEALPKMRAARAKYPGSYPGAYLKVPFHWQVSFFSRNGSKEIGQVIIDDFDGRVLEQWTGFQIAWTMARGYPGAFGRHVGALYVWLPLCVLFLFPFFNFRHPLRLLNLDLLVLLSFSVSLAYFDHGRIDASVPLAYPPLLYLLARMLALLRRAPGRRRRALRLNVPSLWLAIGVIFLLGFRIGLNVTDSNVIDVGYAGVIGAQRIAHGKPLYGSFPANNEHGDTYGPANYEAYVPFEQAFGWSGTWDDLPAAHAAAIAFDLLAMALLFLIGRRMRGPTLGIALAYAWASFPFTLFTLDSNANDTLVAVFVLAAVLASSYRSTAGPLARGAFIALAGLTKLAPLGLFPVFATEGLATLAPARRPRALWLFLGGFLLVGALAVVPAVAHDSLHTIYERTFAYQGSRGSPFSVYGLYGLQGLESVVEVIVVLFALALAVVPRRADLVGLAAAGAAVLIAVQLGIEHWFYLYLPWFFPLVMIALLGAHIGADRVSPGEASAPARSTRPEVVLSS